MDPVAATDSLAASTHPYLIGVRHHSAVLAHAMPALLEAFVEGLEAAASRAVNRDAYVRVLRAAATTARNLAPG